MTDRAENNLIVLPRHEEGSLLTFFDRARREIELASSVVEVKKIRDQAEVLRQYARQQKLSLEMQNNCAEIKIRCERRGGEILVGMDKNHGGQAEHKSYVSQQGTGTNPKLSDLGISRNQSSRWQAIASIPHQQFEERMDSLKSNGKELTSSEMLSYAGYLQRERERNARRQQASAAAAKVQRDEGIKVFHGDFRDVLTEEVVPNASASLVLTDLPYGQEYLELWDSLGQLSQRVLKDGGILAAYSGCFHLPEVLSILGRHLTYCWTAALLNEAFADTIFHPIRVKSLWKPIVLFSKGRPEPSVHENPSFRYLKDVIHGDGLGNLNKEEHPWQQGIGESGYLIEVLSLPGDIVVDPCCGSGTVGVAAKRLNRRFVGCDEDEPSVNITLARLAQEPDPTEV